MQDPWASIRGEALLALVLNGPEEGGNRNSCLDKASHGNWDFCLRDTAHRNTPSKCPIPTLFSLWYSEWAPCWPDSTRSLVGKGAHWCSHAAYTPGAEIEGRGVEIGSRGARGKVGSTERFNAKGSFTFCFYSILCSSNTKDTQKVSFLF